MKPQTQRSNTRSFRFGLVFESGSLYDAQVARLLVVVNAGLELVLLLLQSPRCWDYKHVSQVQQSLTLTAGRLPYSSFTQGCALQHLKASAQVDGRQDWNRSHF